jgi:hypothetical protein
MTNNQSNSPSLSSLWKWIGTIFLALFCVFVFVAGLLLVNKVPSVSADALSIILSVLSTIFTFVLGIFAIVQAYGFKIQGDAVNQQTMLLLTEVSTKTNILSEQIFSELQRGSERQAKLLGSLVEERLSTNNEGKQDPSSKVIKELVAGRTEANPVALKAEEPLRALIVSKLSNAQVTQMKGGAQITVDLSASTYSEIESALRTLGDLKLIESNLMSSSDEAVSLTMRVPNPNRFFNEGQREDQ